MKKMSTTERAAVEAFRIWAVTYDRTVSKELERYAGITHQEVLDRLLQLAQLQNGASVLDVGTGTGWLAIRCALDMEEGQIIGVDVTPEMLAQAALNAEKVGVKGRVQFALASAMSLPYADNQFEVVLSSLALHHTTVTHSLNEMTRVLKPRGRIAIADMGAPTAWRSAPISWLILLLPKVGKLTGSSRAKAEAEAFLQTYTAEEWRSILATKGLKRAQVRAIPRPGQRMYPCVILACGEKGDTIG